MPLIDHLEELRTTIIRVAVIILVTFALAYGFGEYIAEVLLLPFVMLSEVSAPRADCLSRFTR